MDNHFTNQEQNIERVFEFPLNDKMRTFLKIEHLAMGIYYHLHQESFWNVQSCITLLIELSQMFERSDVKGKTAQELDRLRKVILAKQSSDLQNKSLKLQIMAIDSNIEMLTQHQGHFEIFKKNEFMITLRNRFSTSSSQCSFESPAFFRFATGEHSHRVEEIKHWMMPLLPLLSSVELALKLIRDGQHMELVQAKSGQFEMAVPAKVTLQLVTLKIPHEYPLYPEISGGKHQLFVNLIDKNKDYKCLYTNEVPFTLFTANA